MSQFDDLILQLKAMNDISCQERWARVSQQAVAADLPFEQCRELWQATFSDWDPQQVPWPVWSPSPTVIAHANATRFLQQNDLANLKELRHWASKNPVAFWQKICDVLEIHFHRPPACWLDSSNRMERAVWGVGAELNIALSCLPELAPERQWNTANGRAIENSNSGKEDLLQSTRAAIVWQPIHGPLQTISAQQLAKQVQRIACGLHQTGWAGKRLALIMPLTPISVAVYLAALYTGSTVVSIADSFSAPEIANRLRLSNAEVVFTYDQLARGDKLLPLFPRVQQATELPCLVIGGGISEHPGTSDWDGPWLSATPSGLRVQDRDWNFWLPQDDSFPAPSPTMVSAQAAIHLLFSSGTTGDPKVIPWTPLTPIKCAADGFFHQDIHSTDVVAWPTNLGWMMGPWLIFASLLNGAPLALYEDAPLGMGFGKFVQDANVTILGLVPSMVKAWRATSAMESFDWSRIRLFSSTGESSQREDYFYLSWLAGFKPIIEYCGGTEIGGGYISATVLEDNCPATFTGPAIGLDIEILDETGQPTSEGELFIVPPSIGLSQSLVNRDHYQTYYAEAPRSPSGRVLRKHGDYFRRLPNGYYEAGGRTDDTMNLGGIKVSSLELERAINLVAGVRESAAVACSTGGPDQLVVFLVLADGLATRADNSLSAGGTEWLAKLNHAIREQLNPLFKVSEVWLVDQLPRTASNKILRRDLRDRWKAMQVGNR